MTRLYIAASIMLLAALLIGLSALAGFLGLWEPATALLGAAIGLVIGWIASGKVDA